MNSTITETEAETAGAPRPRSPWTRGDRAIMWAIALGLAVLVPWCLWVNSMDADPIVHIPVRPPMAVNGYDYLLAAAGQSVPVWPSLTGVRKRGARPTPPDFNDPKVAAAAAAFCDQSRP